MLYFLEHLTFSATQFADLAAGKVPKVAKGLSGITRKVRKRGLNGAKRWSKVLKKRSLIAFLLTVERVSFVIGLVPAERPRRSNSRSQNRDRFDFAHGRLGGTRLKRRRFFGFTLTVERV
jgi:hypothetical protein